MPSPPTQPGQAPDAGATDSLLALGGTVLESRYELGGVLGAGGMGAVFEAKHLRLDRTVAIKVLRPVFVGHDEYIKRFLREARAASKIRHRNVVEIHDFGEAAGGLVYSVMERLRGQDLEQLLTALPSGRLPWPQACNLLVQAASGLKAVHAAGIIHRDIKPANCFLTTDDDGQPLVKLVDFGIAKLQDAGQSQQLTATAAVLGTPAYIAPELVLTKDAASPRSDIYSFGVLAYRMLSGRVPFSGETAFQVLHRACYEPVPSLRDLAPNVPPAVEAYVLGLLAKTPEERPADVQAVRDALLALGRDTSGSETLVLPAASASDLGLAEAPTLPRAATASGTARVASTTNPPEITRTKVLAPIAEGRAPAAPRPSEAAPTAIVASTLPAVAPQALLLDSGSAPLAMGSSPAMTSLAEAMLPLDDTGNEQRWRPRARRALWLGAGGLAATLAAGAFAVQAMSPSSEPAATSATSVTAAPPTTRESTAPPPTGSEPTPAPPSQPAADLAAAAPKTDPKPKKTKPKKTASKPAEPSSDDVLLGKLVRTIKTNCADLLTGQPLQVSFLVRADGQTMSHNASPKGAAATCAANQAKGTSFRTRTKTESLEVSVK
jgi:serine/threonine protein kinase